MVGKMMCYSGVIQGPQTQLAVGVIGEVGRGAATPGRAHMQRMVAGDPSQSLLPAGGHAPAHDAAGAQHLTLLASCHSSDRP